MEAFAAAKESGPVSQAAAADSDSSSSEPVDLTKEDEALLIKRLTKLTLQRVPLSC
jgi:hypothetical protein